MADTKTYIGIDYGETNIGVALGKNGLVNPISVLSGKTPQVAINELNKLALNNKVECFVVGIPLTAEGKETKKSLKIRQFSKLLRVYSKKKVVFQDEHHSSMDAQKEILSEGLSKKNRHTIDHYSAALILKRFFDENQ